MLIGGMQKLCLGSWQGKIACSLFLAGCNFKCPWCFSVDYANANKFNQKNILSEKDVWQFLKKQRESLDGVILTGGEPCLQKDLLKFCQKIKKLGYQIKLETNGSFPEMLAMLVSKKLVDYVALDIKGPKEKYSQFIGLEGASSHYLVSKIEKSVEVLKNGACDYEFCLTLSPLLQKQDILDVANWLRPAKKFVLKSFQPEKTLDPVVSILEPFPLSRAFQIKEALSPFFEHLEMRI